MEIEFSRAARNALKAKSMPADRRRQIVAEIEKLAANPKSPELDVRPLADSDLWRLRVGSYRVLYSTDIAAGRLTIRLIGTRGDVYKR